MISPAWKYKYTKTKLKIRLCTRPLPVDREIGTRTQHNAAKKARAEDLYSPQEIVCSCTGFQFCTKLLISELSIILSSERGILRKAPQDGGFESSIEVQQNAAGLERPTPDEKGWAHHARLQPLDCSKCSHQRNHQTGKIAASAAPSCKPRTRSVCLRWVGSHLIA